MEDVSTPTPLVTVLLVADENELPFDAEVPSSEPHRKDTADDHDILCMMDGGIG